MRSLGVKMIEIIKNMDTKEKYIAPALTVVSFKVERGFANSLTNDIEMNNFRLFQELELETANRDYNANSQQNWVEPTGGSGEGNGDLFDRW